MHRPPTSPLPIQLLPQAPRAISISAAGFSLSLHVGVLALAVAGTGHWITPQPALITVPQANIGTVTYLAVIASAHPPGRSVGRAAPRIGPSRSATLSETRPPLPRPPPPSRPAVLTLPAPVRQLVLRTGVIESVGGDKLAPTGDSVGTERNGDGAGQHAVAMSTDTGWRGTSRVAELLAGPGNACPELRRPAHLDSEVRLEVAVKFVVDSLGAVDRTTLQVVKAPGTPAIAPGFIPHIYAVGGTARVDRSLPEALPEYGATLADDLLRHVAGLRFRPGTRNGRPTRSSVLVACSADRSGH
jgi:hypothetical protein